MIVLKFGGTSVGNAAMMQQTLDIAAGFSGEATVLVSSAMTKMTDALLSLCRQAAKGDSQAAFNEFNAIAEHHRACARELLEGQAQHAALEDLNRHFTDLEGLVRGLCLIREVSPRSQDAVVSYGERLSTLLLHHKARQRGMDCSWLDARSVVITDDRFGSANLQKEETYQRIKAAVKPKKGQLVITQGFIGSTSSGVTTTLGRGGSDWSATIFGAALDAQRVEIWTDVDGIMTTDPRIIPEAKVLSSISYEEAAELAYFGAKVIHPATIQPAVEKNIPVWVKNTKNPAATGTAILSASAVDSKAHGEGSPAGQARALAGKKNITVITVRSTRMLNAYGFLRSIFAVFEQHKVSVDLVATSEVSVSVTVDDPHHLKSIRRDLEAFAEVEVEEQQAIVCIVGRDLWKDPGFIARSFGVLKGLRVRMISMGSSDINLSLVLPQSELETAIKKLHDELF